MPLSSFPHLLPRRRSLKPSPLQNITKYNPIEAHSPAWVITDSITVTISPRRVLPTFVLSRRKIGLDLASIAVWDLLLCLSPDSLSLPNDAHWHVIFSCTVGQDFEF